LRGGSRLGIDAVGARKVDIGDRADFGSGAEGVESREEVGRRPRHRREAHLVRRAHVAHRLLAEARLFSGHTRASLIPISRWVSRAQHCLPASRCANTGRHCELQAHEGQQAGARLPHLGELGRDVDAVDTEHVACFVDEHALGEPRRLPSRQRDATLEPAQAAPSVRARAADSARQERDGQIGGGLATAVFKAGEGEAPSSRRAP
jgi:hypothetical protein